MRLSRCKQYISILLSAYISLGSAVAYTPEYFQHKDELSHLIDIALVHNSKIRASHDRWIAETYTIPQARALPDPEFNIGYLNLIGSNVLEEPLQGLRNIGAIQAIPFPGKLYMRGKIAQVSTKQASADYRDTTFQTITQLKRRYFDLYFTNRAIDIYQKNKQTLKHMASLAKTRVASNQAPAQDVLMVETEISRIDMELTILSQERESLIADINEQLERALSIPVYTPQHLNTTPMVYDMKQLDDLVKERSPKLDVSRQGMRKSQQEIRLRKMEYFPDVEAQADKLHDKKLNADGYFVGLKATVPLYFMHKQNKALRESMARYNAEFETFQDVYYDLVFHVKNAYLIIERANRLLKLLGDTILPKARETYVSSKLAYEAGQVDFLTFLNNLLTLQKNELDYESELVRREQRIADIEQAIGMYL